MRRDAIGDAVQRDAMGRGSSLFQHGMRLLIVVLLVAVPLPAGSAATPEAFNPSPHAINIPPWFQETFLDFREDVREAAAQGKRLLVYFGQDGCP